MSVWRKCRNKYQKKQEEICLWNLQEYIIKRLPHQLWWTTTLIPPYKRSKYYFELQTEKEVWYYFEDGFLTEEQINMDGRIRPGLQKVYALG